MEFGCIDGYYITKIVSENRVVVDLVIESQTILCNGILFLSMYASPLMCSA